MSPISEQSLGAVPQLLGGTMRRSGCFIETLRTQCPCVVSYVAYVSCRVDRSEPFSHERDLFPAPRLRVTSLSHEGRRRFGSQVANAVRQVHAVQDLRVGVADSRIAGQRIGARERTVQLRARDVYMIAPAPSGGRFSNEL